MVKRGLIIAKIKPGAEEHVAAIFAESDQTELPHLAGVRHRSLFVLDDVYVHLVETDDEFDAAVGGIRDHPLFKEISRKLEPYIVPYTPRPGARRRTRWRGSSIAGTATASQARGDPIRGVATAWRGASLSRLFPDHEFQ